MIICIILAIACIACCCCGFAYVFIKYDQVTTSVSLICLAAIMITCMICSTIVIARVLQYFKKNDRSNSYDDALEKMLAGKKEDKDTDDKKKGEQ